MRANWIRFCVLLVATSAASVQAKTPISAQQTLHRFLSALSQRNLDQAKPIALTHEELASLSKRPMEKKSYEENLQGFLLGMSQDLSSGLKVEKIIVADVLILPEDEKVKREVTLAVLQVTFSLQGKPLDTDPMNFLFVHMAGQWRFFLKT